jgi:hypothetical protein
MTCLAVLFSVGSSQTREARWPSVGFVEVADTTASARLRCDHPQKPGLGISRRDHPGAHPALRHAAGTCSIPASRAAKLVVLVGQKQAVAIAVRNVSGRRRWSKLREWLRPKLPVSRQFGMAS